MQYVLTKINAIFSIRRLLYLDDSIKSPIKKTKLLKNYIFLMCKLLSVNP